MGLFVLCENKLKEEKFSLSHSNSDPYNSDRQGATDYILEVVIVVN